MFLHQTGVLIRGTRSNGTLPCKFGSLGGAKMMACISDLKLLRKP